MQIPQIVIGTRGSKLALHQAGLVEAALKTHHPDLRVETRIITTKGDTNQGPIPASAIGKAWFTAEIEQALQSGAIDLAIHSLKDLPPQPPAGLVATVVLERADPRDTLISKSGATLTSLPPGAVVGTDSLRRQALILHYRPDLVVRSIRGNVDTRLRKLQEEDYDAIMLAAAGLERLGLLHLVTEYYDPSRFVPAIGQGALSAEYRLGHTAMERLLAPLRHESTVQSTQAEQAFSQMIGGGCKLPIGCHVIIKAGIAHVYAMVGNLNTMQATLLSITGSASQARALAERLASQLQETSSIEPI